MFSVDWYNGAPVDWYEGAPVDWSEGAPVDWPDNVTDEVDLGASDSLNESCLMLLDYTI